MRCTLTNLWDVSCNNKEIFLSEWRLEITVTRYFKVYENYDIHNQRVQVLALTDCTFSVPFNHSLPFSRTWWRIWLGELHGQIGALTTQSTLSFWINEIQKHTFPRNHFRNPTKLSQATHVSPPLSKRANPASLIKSIHEVAPPGNGTKYKVSGEVAPLYPWSSIWCL